MKDIKIILGNIELNEEKTAGKTFYVIELFPYPQIVIDEDGITKEFENYDDALEEKEACQNGRITCF